MESVSITWTNCKIEFTESCTMEEKVVGDRITYKEECAEKEVEVCKPVHYIPRFLSKMFVLLIFITFKVKLRWHCKRTKES